MEGELQDAFRNLHNPETSNVLTIVPTSETGEAGAGGGVTIGWLWLQAKIKFGFTPARSTINCDEETEEIDRSRNTKHVASWNYLKYLIETHHPIVLGISEPKQQATKIGEIAF